MASRRSFRRAVVAGAAVLAGAAILGLCSTAQADANSLTDYFGPREISLGEATRADAQGSLATTVNPAGLAFSHQLVFEGSYGYRPGDSASVVGVSACDSTVPVPGCFYYHYLSAQPSVGGMEMSRRVHEFGITAARALTPSLAIGVNARYFTYKSTLDDEGDSSGFATDLGATLRVSDAVQLAAVGYNLVAADSAQYPRGVGGGMTIRPVAQMSIGLDGLWNLEPPMGAGTGRYGAGLQYFIQSADQTRGYPLRAGAVYDNEKHATYLTGGLGLTTVWGGLDVGARKQVAGGDELLVLAGLRLFGPNLP